MRTIYERRRNDPEFLAALAKPYREGCALLNVGVVRFYRLRRIYGVKVEKQKARGSNSG